MNSRLTKTAFLNEYLKPDFCWIEPKLEGEYLTILEEKP